MRINPDTATRVYAGLFGAAGEEGSSNEFLPETDRQIILERLRFAGKLFPRIGLGLCPVSHTTARYNSESCAEIFGHPYDEIQKWSLTDFLGFVHPVDLPSLQQCFHFIRSFERTDPEMHRFATQFRFRNSRNAYHHIRNEHIAIHARESSYIYLMLYSDISREEKFYHVKMDVYKKVNGNYLKTYTYNPQHQEKAITPRQNDIARLVVKGFSNQEIADHLGVSVFTVKNHKQILFRKVNVKNSVELASYVKELST